ncbi:hypothetical protein CQF54_25060 [Salmonella enterica subsp. enterica serovar Typhimurium]|nr:hypothetical protein [Salmonella enterica subsp. enterica serovar Typhimurium]
MSLRSASPYVPNTARKGHLLPSAPFGRVFLHLDGFVNGMVASHLLCHSGTINRHSLNGALLS